MVGNGGMCRWGRFWIGGCRDAAQSRLRSWVRCTAGGRTAQPALIAARGRRAAGRPRLVSRNQTAPAGPHDSPDDPEWPQSRRRLPVRQIAKRPPKGTPKLRAHILETRLRRAAQAFFRPPVTRRAVYVVGAAKEDVPRFLRMVLCAAYMPSAGSVP
jgi:hypothetical protein